MNKWIVSLVVATVSGAVLALPGTASAGMVHVPQTVTDNESAAGMLQVHSRRYRYNYNYNTGSAIVGAIIGGLAYDHATRNYSRRHYGYSGYRNRHGYGNGYGYRRHYGYRNHGYGGYGGYHDYGAGLDYPGSYGGVR